MARQCWLWLLLGLAARGDEPLVLKPIAARPCLLCEPGDVPALKRRFEALVGHPPAAPRKLDPALYGLLYGDEAFRRQACADFAGPRLAPFRVKPGGEYPGYRRYNEMLYFYDVIASFGYLTPAQHTEFRELMVAGAVHYIGAPPRKMGETEGYSNRSVDQALVGVLTGLNFPDHPLAPAWVQFGVTLLRDSLDKMVLEGAWNEVPRYHNWTLLLDVCAFEALRRRTGMDLFQTPNLKALLDWYVRFSSPLVRFPSTVQANPRGEPTTPAWGDSNYGPMFQALAMYAPHYAQTDPAFSRRLMWMWRRAGSPYQHGWQFDLAFPLLADPSLPDEPQTLGSAFCRTLGYALLRSGFDTPDETAVIVRGGRRGALHPRADLGSLDLFSCGIPLALGSQSGPYREPEILWNRSQQSNNCVVFGGQSRDRTDCSGTVDAFFTSPTVDYFVADCSKPGAFRWRRHLLLAKQPDYVVVWDEIASAQSAQWFWHTTAERYVWDAHRVSCRTAYGADLDVHVLLPAAPLTPNEQAGPFGSWLYDNPAKGKEDPYPFTKLKYFALAARPDEHFLVVLHPRHSDASALAPRLVSSSTDRVMLAIGADTVTLGRDGGTFVRGGTSVALPLRVDGPTEPGARFIVGSRP